MSIVWLQFQIKKSIYDVVICNFANADMVAHTGNLEASIKACEVIDECIGKIVAEVSLRGGIVIIKISSIKLTNLRAERWEFMVNG
jgi:bisphosphoglycerate-independent phosphoglycerate mutase (AlkP superfamily)